MIIDMTKNLPAQVTIDGIVYDVTLVKGLRNESGKLDGSVTYAQTLIEIEAEMNQQAQWQTFLHEIFHIISVHRKLNLTEDQTDALSYGAIALFRNQ